MRAYQKETIETYEAQAHAFQDTRAQCLRSDILDRFVSLLPGKTLLDVGCGPGRDTGYLTQKGYTVTGIDLTPRFIALATQAVPDATFVVMDVLSLTFAEQQFHGVFANAVLLHLAPADVLLAMTEIYRVLMPGGIFYASVKQGEGIQHRSDTRLGNAKRLFYLYTSSDIRALAERVGFEILSVEEDIHHNGVEPVPWVLLYAKKPL